MKTKIWTKKISIRNVDKKNEIVALKNSWDENWTKHWREKKKSSESKYDREKTSDAFLYSWYLRKKLNQNAVLL